MDASRFDHLARSVSGTRRRFGAFATIAIVTLLSPTGPDGIEARKKRCKRVTRRCNRDRNCCNTLVCEPVNGFDGDRCCRQLGDRCRGLRHCCGSMFCNDGGRCDVSDSDRNLKANFGSVDPADMLQRVRSLPISTWNYTSDEASVRHIGPMAQDFAAAFGVGADDRHIHPIDGQGVALAAIQGLLSLVESLSTENADLAARLALLEETRCQPACGIEP